MLLKRAKKAVMYSVPNGVGLKKKNTDNIVQSALLFIINIINSKYLCFVNLISLRRKYSRTDDGI